MSASLTKRMDPFRLLSPWVLDAQIEFLQSIRRVFVAGDVFVGYKERFRFADRCSHVWMILSFWMESTVLGMLFVSNSISFIYLFYWFPWTLPFFLPCLHVHISQDRIVCAWNQDRIVCFKHNDFFLRHVPLLFIILVVPFYFYILCSCPFQRRATFQSLLMLAFAIFSIIVGKQLGFVTGEFYAALVERDSQVGFIFMFDCLSIIAFVPLYLRNRLAQKFFHFFGCVSIKYLCMFGFSFSFSSYEDFFFCSHTKYHTCCDFNCLRCNQGVFLWTLFCSPSVLSYRKIAFALFWFHEKTILSS